MLADTSVRIEHNNCALIQPEKKALLNISFVANVVVVVPSLLLARVRCNSMGISEPHPKNPHVISYTGISKGVLRVAFPFYCSGQHVSQALLCPPIAPLWCCIDPEPAFVQRRW